MTLEEEILRFWFPNYDEVPSLVDTSYGIKKIWPSYLTANHLADCLPVDTIIKKRLSEGLISPIEWIRLRSIRLATSTESTT